MSVMSAHDMGPAGVACLYCGMSFPTQARLERHENNVHPEDRVIILDLEEADTEQVSVRS